MKTFKKGLPLLAVVLGLGIFLANGMTTKAKDAKVLGTQWLFKGGILNPEDPASYEEYFGDLGIDCEGEAEICGIIAPVQDTINLPHISGELLERIQQQTTGDDDVFLRPHNPKI